MITSAKPWQRRLVAFPALIAALLPFTNGAKSSSVSASPRVARSITDVFNATPKLENVALSRKMHPVFDTPTVDRRAALICDVPDGAWALNPRNVKVYREFQNAICREAIRFDVDPRLLAITLQHEGNGRMGAVRVKGMAFRDAEYYSNIAGRGESVGIGQMQPRNAVALAERYDHEHISYDEARRRLVYDDNYGVHITAAYLRHLQEDEGFNDKEAFIAYAYPPALYTKLREKNFDGEVESIDRGHRYNELFEQINGLPGYGERVVSTLDLIG